MAFDSDTWKAKVQERLQGWKGRMQQVGAPSSYWQHGQVAANGKELDR